MNAVALLISPSGEPAPRLPLAGGLLVVLEGTAVNPRPLVCRCCSEEQHLLASFNVPPWGVDFRMPTPSLRLSVPRDSWESLVNFNMRLSVTTRLGVLLSA